MRTRDMELLTHCCRQTQWSNFHDSVTLPLPVNPHCSWLPTMLNASLEETQLTTWSRPQGI